MPDIECEYISFDDDVNDDNANVKRNLSGVNESKKIGKSWLRSFPLVRTSLNLQKPLFPHQITKRISLPRVQQTCYELQVTVVATCTGGARHLRSFEQM